MGELNLSLFVVERSVKVEEMSFEQDRIGVFVERRTPPQVKSAVVLRTVGTPVSTRVHSLGRQTDSVPHLDVRSREAEQPPTLIAGPDHASDLERTAEHRVCQSDIATGERSSNRCRTDRLVDAISSFEQFDRTDIEVMIGTELTQHRHIAFTTAPEVEVGPDYDGRHSKMVDENSLDERLGGFVGLFLVKRDEDDGVESSLLEEFKSLFGAREQLRRGLRAHDGGWVLIEGDQHGASLLRLRQLTHLLDH